MLREQVLCFVSLGLFILAVAFFLSGQAIVAGVILAICGLSAIAFSWSISRTLQFVARARLSWLFREQVRPVTIVLWGFGICVADLVLIFDR
jgi:hypothetical protein